ncbi:MAG TPA: NAD-dependent epimerase/dehydratase family protein [Thermoleophilaceae bacterium]|nr:NAD-dependent epimerase/dehydratase family protein [Thermoleophilaceae bacterium]
MAHPRGGGALSRWKDVPVLVTGAQGFVGSWLAERLLDERARVVTLLRDVEPDSRFNTDGIAARCTQVRSDLTDYDAMTRALNEHGIRAVFHLAAQTIVGTANRSPLSTYETNIRGTYTLLEACRGIGVVRNPIERIVVASSDKAYGRHEQLPYREDFALRPLYPYDVSKAATDMIARSYAATYDMPVAVTRLANVYGGGDPNRSRIVPDTILALKEGRPPVIRSDGSPERDYLYVGDAVDAYLAIAESLDDRANWGRAWNAGTGTPVSVRDLVDQLIRLAGAELEPDVQGEGTPHGEIDRQFLDSSAIRAELGWQPRWDLERGLAATWEWYAADGSRQRR